MGHKRVAAASSGIAATLLKGGRTAHSFFGIPIPVLNTSTCDVKLNTKLGKLLNETKLSIWDEALMTHTYNILAVSRMLKDLNNNDFKVEEVVIWYMVVVVSIFHQFPIRPR